MTSEPTCTHCRGTGTVWKGGQGGDYEVCSCRKLSLGDFAPAVVDGAFPKTVREVERVQVVAEHRTRVARDFGIADFTCDTCAVCYSCVYAFDPYNEDGDCIAEK